MVKTMAWGFLEFEAGEDQLVTLDAGPGTTCNYARFGASINEGVLRSRNRNSNLQRESTFHQLEDVITLAISSVFDALATWLICLISLYM